MCLHTKGREADNVLCDHDHFSCCSCLGGAASPQPPHPPKSDFFTVASQTKSIWNHFEVHCNSPKGDKQASQTKRRKMNNASALLSVINGISTVLGNSFCYAIWILKRYRSSSFTLSALSYC